MLVAGSDDGAYRVTGVGESGQTTAEKVLDAGRVPRVRQFEALPGLFAATQTGLYHSLDGTDWTDLGVPTEKVYAVCASPDGERLYAGTRPARVYVSSSVSSSLSDEEEPSAGMAQWRELDGFRDLRSREWRKDRHDDTAQVRSLHAPPDAPDRVVAGVEVGGVHVSEDRGETWDARNETVHDDVHHVEAVSAEEYVASTGFGLFRTTDAGRSWTRLDAEGGRRYFRESFSFDGTLYAGGAFGSSVTWDDETPHALFACRDGETLTEIESPAPDELFLGWCEMDGDLLGATHRGTLFRKRGDDWQTVGRVPVTDNARGRYLPLSWYEP